MRQLPAEDRALIDEAIADGRVQTIPEGVSGEDHEIKWNTEKGKLEYTDKEAAKRRAKGSTSKFHMKRPGKAPDPEVAKRRQRVADHVKAGLSVAEIMKAEGLKEHIVRNDAHRMGVTPPRKRPGRPKSADGDKTAIKKAQRAQKKAKKVKDRRRFKTAPVPMGDPAILVPADMDGTRFPNRVFTPDGEESVLKDGANNSKIGGDVLVGRLKGAYIATLTLEERATCPRSCGHWRSCYGNSMDHARRWRHGPEFESQLREEVKNACAESDHVLIRLHILGDFYSFEYVCLWADLLDTHENLTVFGFTARQPGTPIGDAITKLRDVYPDRFMIRTSGTCGVWGSFTVDFPTEAKTIGDALVCPEQRYSMLSCNEQKAKFRGKNRGSIHCGNCGACWATDRPIAFVVH